MNTPSRTPRRSFLTHQVSPIRLVFIAHPKQRAYVITSPLRYSGPQNNSSSDCLAIVVSNVHCLNCIRIFIAIIQQYKAHDLGL